MKNRILWIGLFVVTLLVVLALLPSVRYPFLGWLRGEKFIDGYPASYWLMMASQPYADSKDILRLGKTGPEAVPVLLHHALLEERTESMSRINAVKALIELGPAAKSAIPQLIHVFYQEQNPGSASPAYYAAKNVLKGLGPVAVEATDQLISLLSNFSKRDDAALVLSAIGPGAKAAIPHMLEALKQDSGPAIALCHALSSLCAGDPARANEAIPVMLAAFHRAGSSGDLIQALLKLHRSGVSVIAHAVSALESKHLLTRQGAAFVLAELGAEAKEAIPALEKMTKDENEHLRYAAQQALKKIKPSTQ